MVLKLLKTIITIVYFPFHVLITSVLRMIGGFRGKSDRKNWQRLFEQVQSLTNEEKYDDAIICCKKIIQSIPTEYRTDNQYYFNALTSLAELYRITADYENAETAYIEVFEITTPDSYEWCLANIGLGTLYTDTGKYKEAEACLLKSYNQLSAFREDKYFEVVTYNLYTLYLQLGQLDKAEQFLKESTNSVHPAQRSASDSAMELYASAKLLCEKRKYSEAEIMAKESVTVFEDNKITSSEHADALLLLAELSLQVYKPEQVLQYSTRAQEIVTAVYGETHILIANCLSYIGIANLLLGNEDLAEAQISQAANMIKNIKGEVSIDYLKMLKTMAVIYFGKANYTKCESIFSVLMDVYLLLMQLHYPQMTNDERIAFINHWHVNKLNLYDYLVSHAGHSPEFLRKCFEFRLNVKWTLLEDVRNLGQDNIKYDKIRNSLSENDLLVEVIRFYQADSAAPETTYYIFFIVTAESSDGPLMVVLNNGNDLDGNYYLDYINANIKRSIDFNSFARYWQPIETVAPEKNRIFLSPDGTYRKINLSTLRAAKGIHLLENKQVVLCHDLRNLPAMQLDTNSFKGKAVLIGNPTFNGNIYSEELNPANEMFQVLPSSGQEVKEISDILQNAGKQTAVYTGENVSKAIFLDTQAIGVLHLATHGFYRIYPNQTIKINELMDASGLLLSNAFDTPTIEQSVRLSDNGYLNGTDIMRMNLRNTDLVVLSACFSGIGIQNDKGDTFGFERTFFLAGAKSLIMSLWKIEDDVAMEFMIQFYSEWMKTGDKYRSYYKAQLYIKNKYKHPFYWGGFVLVFR
ncbi:MAG: CHAT domain-containing protein [Ignavibacteriales bacterium]|nr:CHAT domain-containing protein [Ignavibacteriales bacterium]